MDSLCDNQNTGNTILGATNNILERHSCRIEVLEMNKGEGSGQFKKNRRRGFIIVRAIK
jgi:hypothetical protein